MRRRRNLAAVLIPLLAFAAALVYLSGAYAQGGGAVGNTASTAAPQASASRALQPTPHAGATPAAHRHKRRKLPSIPPVPPPSMP
jgi:hypothetical protein